MFAAALTCILSPALAGYGDVDEDGYPTAAERQVHIWTNAARVDPEAFADEYPCSFDEFQPEEQTPKAPLHYARDLNNAARFHSTDMAENDWFDHASSDGTSFGDRLARFYDSGYVGENIAYGYPNPYAVLFQGWMCSEGHRANIMTTGWTELGVGVVGTHYTQNFGGGAADAQTPLAMGAHEPTDATDAATFLADWHDANPPARLQLVLDGQASSLELVYGESTRGIFTALAEPDEAECHAYYFYWQTADGLEGTFPETGSYTYGTTCSDEIGWIPSQAGAAGGGGPPGAGNLDTDDLRLAGCASLPLTPTAPLLAVSALIGIVLSRRPRRSRNGAHP